MKEKKKMSELNQFIKSTEQRASDRRAAAVLAAIVMSLLISLTLTIKADAGGQFTLIVSDAGMTPTSATMSGGIIHLKLQNTSSRDTITLRISRENGGLVREIVLAEGVRELSTEVEIGAGQYVVTETSNTAWNCTLTIQ